MLSFIMIITPAIIAVLIYEKINQRHFNVFRFIVITLGFTFVIRLLTITALWGMGETSIVWLEEEMLSSLGFSGKYMGLTLVFAIALPFLVSGLNQNYKRKKNEK